MSTLPRPEPDLPGSLRAQHVPPTIAHTWVAVTFEGHRGYVSQPPSDGTTCMCGAWTWAEANDTCHAMAEWLKWSQQQGALS